MPKGCRLDAIMESLGSMDKTHKAMQLQISQVLGSSNTLEVSFNESVRFTEKRLVGIEATLDIIIENMGICGLEELLKIRRTLLLPISTRI